MLCYFGKQQTFSLETKFMVCSSMFLNLEYLNQNGWVELFLWVIDGNF